MILLNIFTGILLTFLRWCQPGKSFVSFTISRYFSMCDETDGDRAKGICIHYI